MFILPIYASSIFYKEVKLACNKRRDKLETGKLGQQKRTQTTGILNLMQWL